MHAAKQGLAATNYPVRTIAFLYCFAVIWVVLCERDAGPLAWTLLVLQFIAYPHAVYWRARRAAHPRRAELENLFLDSVLLGAWCAALGFPTWITLALVNATTLNAMVNRGARGCAWSLACNAAGAGLWVLMNGLQYAPATSDAVMLLCAVGMLSYTSAVGYVVHSRSRRRRRALPGSSLHEA